MITAKLYIPEAQAEIDGKDFLRLQLDNDFRFAVKMIVMDYCVADGYVRDVPSSVNLDIDCR